MAIGHEESHAVGYNKGLVKKVSVETSLDMAPEQMINAVFKANFENEKVEERRIAPMENQIRKDLDPSGTKLPAQQTRKTILEVWMNGKYYALPATINLFSND